MVKLQFPFLVMHIVVLKDVVLNTQYISLLLPTSFAQVHTTNTLLSNRKFRVLTDTSLDSLKPKTADTVTLISRLSLLVEYEVKDNHNLLGIQSAALVPFDHICR